MYTEATVIVNGGLEETAIFHDYLMLEDWLDGVEEDAEAHGYLTEVYFLEHGHSEDVAECECVQYLQDHRPSHVFNGEDEDETATYRIRRFCFNSGHPDHHRVMATGLTLEEAQAHCQDEDTHGVDDERGQWFDGYDEE